MAKMEKALQSQWLGKANVRTLGDQLLTIDIFDIIAHFKVRKLVLRSGREGGEYVQARFGPDLQSHINIGIGKSVKLTKRGVARIDELLDYYVVYTGDKLADGTVLKSPWFSFGAEADPNSNVIAEMDFDEDAVDVAEIAVTQPPAEQVSTTRRRKPTA